MSRIPDDVIEQVRDSVDLLELVGESVELKRTGTAAISPSFPRRASSIVTCVTKVATRFRI